LSAALAADRGWAAGLFVAGVVTIFTGFLVHMSKLNLGRPRPDAPVRAVNCPWKFSAMLLVAAVVVVLGCWLPRPLFQLVEQTARIIGGAS
jgi:hypothetical protein